MSSSAGSSGSAKATYEIRDIVNKGKGMVAAKDLVPGEIIVSEKPVLLLGAGETRAQAVYNQFLALNESDRARLQALTCNLKASAVTAYAEQGGSENAQQRERILAICDTNGMETRGGTWRYVAVESARMNHSCKPNATYDYFLKDHLVIVRPLQKIAQGEEITIPYVYPLLSKAERAKRLLDNWGFTCACEACTTSPLLSDKVITKLDLAHTNLNEIRGRANKAALHPDKFETDEQMKCCKFFVERTVSIKALIPNTVIKLETYLRLLERNGQAGTPEGKKWYGEAYRLALICRGPDDDFVKQCGEMLKQLSAE